jgi:hypothetical protein
MTAVHFGRPHLATVDCAPLLPAADTVSGDPCSGPLGIRPTDTRAIGRHDVTRYVPFCMVTGREAANKTQGYTLLHSLPEQPMSRYHPYPVRRPAVSPSFRREA